QVRLFSCDSTTAPTTSVAHCQEIPIKDDATGQTLTQYTDRSYDNPRSAIIPLASAAPIGGDTAQIMVKCGVQSLGSGGGGALPADGDKGDITRAGNWSAL